MDLTIKKTLSDPRIQLIHQCVGSQGELHLVGGALRDSFLGRVSNDLDLATVLHPEVLAQILQQGGIRVIPTGLQHQTVSALPVPDQRVVEITTFRGIGISPAKGVVASSTITEDLALRDFTINAIAYSLDSGAVIDPEGGIQDIRDRTVRAVRDPRGRFSEDPLRVLRMVRFACELGFGIESETREAAREFCAELALVSPERIRDEFLRILLSPAPRRGVETLAELGLLQVFLPELCEGINFAQNRFHTSDVFQHTLDVVEATRPESRIRLAALFHDIAKPRTAGTNPKTGDRTFYNHEVVGAKLTEEILARLRFSNEVRKETSKLVQLHMRPIECGAAGLRRLLRDTGELFPTWRELKEADSSATKANSEELAEKLKVFDEEIEKIRSEADLSPLKNLAIRGKHLLAKGLTPGPHIGEILRALHEQVLDDPSKNTPEYLLKEALRLHTEHQS